MLKPINDLPPHVTGIHAFGDVSKKEYENKLIPVLNEHLVHNRKINFILILETDIANFEPGLWCGTMNIGLKYFFKWNKVAVVSDKKNVHGYSDLFKFIIPGKYRSFKLDQLDQALKWVASRK